MDRQKDKAFFIVRARNYTTEAIVLGRRDFSEADKIIVVFSKSIGKLFLIAKGVKKLTSRKRGHLEVFSHIRFSAAKGKNLDIITEVETIENYSDIRQDLRKVAVAYFFVETVARLTQEEEPHPKVFQLLISYLDLLKEAKNLKKLRDEFTLDILVNLGFWSRSKPLLNPDLFLESVTERQINSVRIGKKLLSKV